MAKQVWTSPLTVAQIRGIVNGNFDELYEVVTAPTRKWTLGNPRIYESPVALNPTGYNTSQVITMMDETLSSSMVSKTQLGVDGLGNAIFEYVYDKTSPSYIEIVSGVPLAKPYPYPREKAKILINSGSHGDEKGSPVGLALFLQELVTNTTSEELRFIRDNATLKVIPILNPSGFNAGTRNNHNNIDINRDFVNFTQAETLLAKAWIDTNTDALGILDVHNTVGAISLWDYIGQTDDHELCFSLLSNLESIWQPRLPLSPPYGSVYGSDNTLNMQSYVATKNIYSTTVESSRNSVSTNGVSSFTFDALAVQMGKELLVNLIISLIKRNS
jgi:hypothetical protein